VTSSQILGGGGKGDGGAGKGRAKGDGRVRKGGGADKVQQIEVKGKGEEQAESSGGPLKECECLEGHLGTEEGPVVMSMGSRGSKVE